TRVSRDWSSDVCSSDLLLLTYSRLPLQDTLPPALFVATAIVTTVLAFALTLGWTACRNGLIGLALFCAVMTVWAYGTQYFYPARSEERRGGEELISRSP